MFICSLFQSAAATVAPAATVAAVAAAATAVVEPPFTNLFEYRPDVPGITDRRTGEWLTISICLCRLKAFLFIHFL